MKYIDLDSLPWYTKQQLAEHQLFRAIRLLLDDHDAISALTLAGAAEDILGSLVALKGEKHSLESFIDECIEMGRLRHGEEWKRKEFAEMSNFTRNALKHYDDGADVCVTEDAACEMIDRAIENLWKLTGQDPEEAARYLDYRHSRCG